MFKASKSSNVVGVQVLTTISNKKISEELPISNHRFEGQA